jgi:hypothetical protein
MQRQQTLSNSQALRTRGPAASLALALTLLFAAKGAHAEDSRGVKAQFLERDTTYVFDDDPMVGDTLGAGSERIRVRPRGARSTLIRPRVQFIREIFKSTEAL